MSIDTRQNTDYTAKRELYCIKDEDVWEIEKLENLEFLTINNQREIHEIDISNFKKLKSLEITRCENLQEITGLTENRTLSELKIYSTNSIAQIIGLDKFIVENENLENLELDVLYYPSAIGYTRTGKINVQAVNKLDLIDYIKWSESVSNKATTINHTQMKKMHEKACEIIKEHFPIMQKTIKYQRITKLVIFFITK